jgi:hypothetical protein
MTNRSMLPVWQPRDVHNGRSHAVVGTDSRFKSLLSYRVPDGFLLLVQYNVISNTMAFPLFYSHSLQRNLVFCLGLEIYTAE